MKIEKEHILFGAIMLVVIIVGVKSVIYLGKTNKAIKESEDYLSDNNVKN